MIFKLFYCLSCNSTFLFAKCRTRTDLQRCSSDESASRAGRLRLNFQTGQTTNFFYVLLPPNSPIIRISMMHVVTANLESIPPGIALIYLNCRRIPCTPKTPTQCHVIRCFKFYYSDVDTFTVPHRAFHLNILEFTEKKNSSTSSLEPCLTALWSFSVTPPGHMCPFKPVIGVFTTRHTNKTIKLHSPSPLPQLSSIKTCGHTLSLTSADGKPVPAVGTTQ